MAARIRNGSLFERRAEFGGAAGEGRHDRFGQADLAAAAFWIASTASPSELPGCRLKESVTAGNCPSCMIASGAVTGLQLREGAQRHHLAGRRFDVDLVAAPPG